MMDSTYQQSVYSRSAAVAIAQAQAEAGAATATIVQPTNVNNDNKDNKDKSTRKRTSAMATTSIAMYQQLTMHIPRLLPARLLPRHMHQDLQRAAATVVLRLRLPRRSPMLGLWLGLKTGSTTSPVLALQLHLRRQLVWPTAASDAQ
jgi:hypothetical protein